MNYSVEENQFNNFFLFLKLLLVFGMLLLSACGGGGPKNKVTSSRYSNYMPNHPNWRPPGTAQDPWGPYIMESSNRFKVPDQWIRTIIKQESNGYQYYNKKPITSPHGAKGLMQLKTATYKDMAKRYHLGSDPYQPRDNIMAGTGYIRILYTRYGAPGFVAAYHGGPGALDAFLKQGKPLSKETKKYLAAVAPKLGNDIPMSGPFAGSHLNRNAVPLSLDAYYQPKSYVPIQVAENQEKDLPQPIPVQKYEQETVSAQSDEPPIIIAHKSTIPTKPIRHSSPVIASGYIPAVASSNHSGNWGIQVGAFTSRSLAQQEANKAQRLAKNNLSCASPVVEVTQKNDKTFYRARLIGVGYAEAAEACAQLKQKGLPCITIQPGA